MFPASHKQPYWTHPQAPTVTKYGSEPASATALHSVTAQKSTEQCEVCHGAGGVNAPFCKACHKLEMPHTKEFKQFHAKTGRAEPGGLPELPHLAAAVQQLPPRRLVDDVRRG